jgi:hypothetical protein
MNPLKLGNSPGGFSELGVDIRGARGQIVAPGSWRADGKRYECDPEHTPFLKAFVDGTIPALPEAFVKLIGTKPATKDVSEKETAALIEVLKSAELPDAVELLDPTIGVVDLEEIAERDSDMRALRDNPDGGAFNTVSDDRWHFFQCLRAHHPLLSVVEVFAIARHLPVCGVFVNSDKPTTGEYNLRNVARDYLRTAPDSHCPPSTGEQFAEVEDEETETNLTPEVQAKREDEAEEREALAENIRRKAEREAAEREAAAEAAELAARETALLADIAGSKNGESTSVKPDKPETAKKAKPTKGMRGGHMWKEFVAPEWSIAGVIPQVGVGMAYGDSNVGKTFLALHMLDRVQRGEAFLGRRTRSADTLYVCGEGYGGISLRMRALYDERPFKDIDDTIHVRDDLPTFAKSPENAAKEIKLMALEAKKASGRDVGLIVIDNWQLLVGDHEENDNSFAASIFKALATVAKELKCFILILHHTSKDQKNYRGPSALRAACDVMYAVKMTKELIRECEISCSKMRDGPKPPKMTYRLKEVTIGKNEHKEPVTSCVVLELGPDIGTAMGDVDDEAPPIKVSDTRPKRIEMLTGEAHEEAARSAAEEESLAEVALTPLQLATALNRRRSELCSLDGQPLTELDKKEVWRLLKVAVAEGKLTKRGADYFLPADED